ncbi:hypothetical protein [Pseudomonas sp. Ps21-P2]|uniref:hypothetical protein n=1 Tax=Pseudomonas sp. Ps21-P2 TaxID=3080331 RepID=UPI00320B6616
MSELSIGVLGLSADPGLDKISHSVFFAGAFEVFQSLLSARPHRVEYFAEFRLFVNAQGSGNMTQAKRNKTLSGSFAFAGLAYGVLLFFLVLIWFLPERAQVIAHFRAYMLPVIFFGATGSIVYREGKGSAEKAGKCLMAMAYLSSGAFLGLFIYTFLTGK